MGKYFFAGFFFVCINSFSQIYNYKLTWTNNKVEKFGDKKVALLNFEEEHFYYPESSIPIFVKYIKTDNDHKEAILLNYNTEIISDNDLKIIEPSNISTEFVFKSQIAYQRKQPYIYFELNPIRYNDKIGKYERITSFSVEVRDNSNFSSNKSTWNFTNNSVLSNGKWIKIKITQTGMYKLTYNQLRNMGFNNPSNIKIYGNGGKFLSYYNNKPRVDDLAEIPIYMYKGPDDIFNEGDYILFYAKDPVSWNYDPNNSAFIHSLHPYSDVSYYFLTDYGSSPKEISIVNYDTLVATHIVSSFDDYAYYEKNINNFLKSGRLWVGESFNYNLSQTFSFYFPDLIPNSSVFLQCPVYAQSNTTSSFTFNVNGTNIGTQSVYGSSTSGSSIYGETFKKRFTHNSNQINITITYNKPAIGGTGWIDYVLVNVRRYLNFNGGQMLFRDVSSYGNNNIAEYRITTSKSNAFVWDVTDPLNPFIIKTNFENNILSFKAPANEIREYIIFDNTQVYSPIIVKEVANQNLHSLSNIDMVVISSKALLPWAYEIAQLHRDYDNLTVFVTTPEEIYNEFSSGMPDVAAIKFFMKMLYERAGNDSLNMPKYLLLFGDGSYNNSPDFVESNNYILTYQSAASLNATGSLTTDDFYGLLDDNEYEYTGLLDIGVGRIPVKTPSEAQSVVNKIKNYYNNRNKGDWKSWITFLADDEDANEHIAQSNTLAQYVENNFPYFIIDKIFLDAFPQKTTPTGDRYPDAHEAIMQRMKKGCLIFNYTGHGNEFALTHEHVIIQSDIISWTNLYSLPFFITATCEFGRWDDHNRISGGELTLLNPNGGGIGLLTTTRLVYSTSNFSLNKAFFETVFPKNINGEYLRLGDAYRISKNKTGGLADINKRNFSLLCDPAIKIAFPLYKVITDSINGISAQIFTDTIHPLQKVKICGHIENNNNEVYNLNGEVIITVLDKPTNVVTLANDGGSPYNFKSQKDILFKGKASVINGYFKCEFIMPKDVKYTNDKGKIIYYAYQEGSIIDASGSFDSLKIGGEVFHLSDNKGPEISLFMNNENFSDGGITDESPTLLVKLYDESGINVGSSSIGHDISATLDNSNKYILNSYYISDKDNYKKGSISYSLRNLNPGEHIITVKAWDVANNSSEKSLRFIVKKSEELTINRVINYPNPFTTKTEFFFEHNNPATSLDVTLQIFTVTGKLVKTIQTTIISEGYRSPGIEWDGKDNFGDNLAPGVYFYKISVKTENNKYVEKFEKLVKLK